MVQYLQSQSLSQCCHAAVLTPAILVQGRGMRKRKTQSHTVPDEPLPKRSRGRPRTRPLSPVLAPKPSYTRLLQQRHPDRLVLAGDEERPQNPISKWDVPLPWPEECCALSGHAQPPSYALTSSTAGSLMQRQRRRSSSRRRPSPLERLPVEVLQRIFLESMNSSLPLASPELLHRLNSDHIKLEFSLRLLCPPRGCWSWTKPAGLAAEQGKLLSLRFFDWNFYKRYTARAYRIFGGWPSSLSQGCRARLDKQLAENPDFDALDIFSLECELGENIAPFLWLHEDTPMPEKLLRGPWDPGKKMLLRLLLIRNLGIDWESSTTCETLVESLMAIATENDPGHADVAHFLIQMAVDANISLPQRLLRCAVTNGGCERWLVERMLDWSLRGNTDYFDPVLWNWAERGPDRAKGHWLMAQLKAAARRKDEMVAITERAPERALERLLRRQAAL